MSHDQDSGIRYGADLRRHTPAAFAFHRVTASFFDKTKSIPNRIPRRGFVRSLRHVASVAVVVSSLFAQSMLVRYTAAHQPQHRAGLDPSPWSEEFRERMA